MTISTAATLDDHYPAGQLLGWAPAVAVDPVAHLALTSEAAGSLLIIYPPVVRRTAEGRPELAGDAELSVGLLKKLPPATVVRAVQWPEELPPLRVRTHCLLRQADFAERAESLWPLLPTLVSSHAKNKDIARALQAHPAQLSRWARHD